MSAQAGNILTPVILLSILTAVILLAFFMYPRAKKFNIELTNTYTNNTTGFSFKYPKKGKVYKWSDEEENNLRVSTEKNNQGEICDVYVDNAQRNNPRGSADFLSYNGLAWTKWKDIENTGSVFDSHFVSWYAKHNNNWVVITGNIEIEAYCENLVSTFSFTK